MRVLVRIRGVDGSEELAEHTERRVHQHLSRFGRQVAGVTVRLSDVNGPRGGRDKRCQVTVTGPLIGTLHLTETHDDEFHDIARVRFVDPSVIARTRKWLVAQQRGDGGFDPDKENLFDGAVDAMAGNVFVNPGQSIRHEYERLDEGSPEPAISP